VVKDLTKVWDELRFSELQNGFFRRCQTGVEPKAGLRGRALRRFEDTIGRGP